jgi:hypothetical protein
MQTPVLFCLASWCYLCCMRKVVLIVLQAQQQSIMTRMVQDSGTVSAGCCLTSLGLQLTV